MKALAILPLFAALASAATAPVIWDASDPVALNYAVWVRKAGETNWTWTASTSQNFYRIDGLSVGMWEAQVTAIGIEGIHSEPSNTLIFAVPEWQNGPANLRLKVAVQTTETPDVEASWQNYAVTYLDGAAERQFIRAVFQ